MMRYFAAGAVILATLLILVLIYFYRSFSYDLDKLINFNPPLTTQVFDAKGRLIANVFDSENRVYAAYEEMPNILVEALIATEDTAFFEHKGISFEAILRALVKDIIAGKAVEGASTLTQQLVKTTLLTSEKTASRKIKEALIAFKVEEKLTKQQILERYLNQIYFGHGYYGIKTAAWGYFRKNLNELTLKEAAILVGLPKAPSFFDPVKNMEGSNQRANTVINRMRYLGWIDDDTHAKAIAEVPKVYNEPINYNKAPYAVDAAIRILSAQYPDIKNGGYKIDLTIDLDLQEAADAALKGQYDEIVKSYGNKNMSNFNGALISVEQATGNVLALSGGVDFYKSPFNRIVQAKRQAGSSFKPFIYLVGTENGFTPDSLVSDTPKSYTFGGKAWNPQNYDLKYDGIITLREALTHSKNLATIDLVEKVGMDRVKKELNRFGFAGVQADLSVALGSYTVSPFEFSEAYTILSNYGTKVTHRLVKSIKTRNGQTVVFESKKESIAAPEQVYAVIEMMKNVVTSGTGTRAAVPGTEVAGKTGTTNDYRDAWFCGFTPSVQTLVWFGNDDNKPLPGKMTGGVVSAPVFARYNAAVLRFKPDSKREFFVPGSVFGDDANVTDSNASGQQN
ncbi:MAG: PBP1A family penicillin-binding protein [Campylobacterales bacterium]|nr:PBP1A family penicillin-binding protein [Campylobacterales bacterium]